LEKKFISNDISLKMEIEFDDNFKKFNLEKDLFEKEKINFNLEKSNFYIEKDNFKNKFLKNLYINENNFIDEINSLNNENNEKRKKKIKKINEKKNEKIFDDEDYEIISL
jgi:hypothetical protein